MIKALLSKRGRKFKNPILGFRNPLVGIFNQKATGIRKYLGIGIVVYAILPLWSFWSLPIGLFLLSGLSFNLIVKKWKYELSELWRLR